MHPHTCARPSSMASPLRPTRQRGTYRLPLVALPLLLLSVCAYFSLPPLLATRQARQARHAVLRAFPLSRASLPHARDPAVATPLATSHCAALAEEHGISQLTMREELAPAVKREWRRLGCREMLPSLSVSEGPTSAERPAGKGKRGKRRPRIEFTATEEATPPVSGDAASSCLKMKKKHGVLVGTSWGTLPPSGQKLWDQLDCNNAEPSTKAAREQEEAYMADYSRRHRAALLSRPASRRLHSGGLGEASTREETVAVCVCTTSRNTNASSLEELALFSIMLPSLTKSLASTPRGFVFHLYILFDAGDAFYDSSAREEDVQRWLQEQLIRPLGEAGVTLKAALLRFENQMRKPGPAFNFMMAAAYEDGADYMYRVNDDTKFMGPWVGVAVEALKSFRPPNVGVVGPICPEGNTLIMTHDFVHRTHLKIFEHYYPPIFSDWWMDDWITHVYGAARTKKGPFRVRHLFGHQGTRYEVDQAHASRLESELEAGRKQIVRWLHHHSTANPSSDGPTVGT